jgi:hypothetical protein
LRYAANAHVKLAHDGHTLDVNHFTFQTIASVNLYLSNLHLESTESIMLNARRAMCIHAKDRRHDWTRVKRSSAFQKCSLPLADPPYYQPTDLLSESMRVRTKHRL